MATARGLATSGERWASMDERKYWRAMPASTLHKKEGLPAPTGKPSSSRRLATATKV